MNGDVPLGLPNAEGIARRIALTGLLTTDQARQVVGLPVSMPLRWEGDDN